MASRPGGKSFGSLPTCLFSLILIIVFCWLFAYFRFFTKYVFILFFKYIFFKKCNNLFNKQYCDMILGKFCSMYGWGHYSCNLIPSLAARSKYFNFCSTFFWMKRFITEIDGGDILSNGTIRKHSLGKPCTKFQIELAL